MKNLKNNKNSFKMRVATYLAALACLFFGSLQSAQGQSVTIAQFFERNGTQDFRFTNNGGASGTFDTVPAGSPILFVYQNIVGLDPSLTSPQNATLTILPSTTTAPASLSTNTLLQSLNQTTVIRVLRDTPAPVGVGRGARTNLLTATISMGTATPQINGTDTGNSAGFNVTTPDHTITYTSDFLTFSMTTGRNLGVTLSSVTPVLALGLGGFLQTFTGAGAGTFASSPAPIVLGPTAASVSVSGRVLTPSGRTLRNAQVTLTEADGSSRTILTGNFGHYSFTNLAAGQTVILTVRSKRYRFVSQILTLTDNLNNVDFVPEL